MRLDAPLSASAASTAEPLPKVLTSTTHYAEDQDADEDPRDLDPTDFLEGPELRALQALLAKIR